MTEHIGDFVNDAPPVARIGNIQSYVSSARVSNPIETFRRALKETLDAGRPEHLNGSKFFGRLLFLRVMASTERYFRNILSECLYRCPTSRVQASEKTVNLGGTLWHGADNFIQSAFDHVSFSSSKEIRSASEQYIGFKLEDAAFKVPLSEYNKICHLRHSVAHSDGIVPGRNAIQLLLPSSSKPLEIVFGYAELQEAASVANTLVTTYNRELFSTMCRRWAIDWRRLPDWAPEEEVRRFKPIWQTFACTTEATTKLKKHRPSMKKCIAETKNIYNI